MEVPTAAYLHIPFCRRRCFYCDFPISVVGDRPPQARRGQPETEQFGTIAEYVEILCQEIRATPAPALPLQTVFLGGGTPSLLLPEQVDRLLATLHHQMGIAVDAEISMEIDPDTANLAHLQGYQAAGVNRVSLGAQAFQVELLKACGRTHTPQDIYRAVELLHQVGVANISLDLISGLPHLTLDDWQDSLQQAIALNPTHLSVYDLTIEPGTAFDRWYQPGAQPLPSDEMTAEMYRTAQQVLTATGYSHYEISNYAKLGYACRHNRVYWENRPYYGFGMAAASYTHGQRFTRPRKRREYYQWVQSYQQSGSLIDCPIATPTDRLLDTLMLGLRLAEGLNLTRLTEQFGSETIDRLLADLQPYVMAGWVSLKNDERGLGDRRLQLTDPEGFLFSNVVLTTLFEKFGP